MRVSTVDERFAWGGRGEQHMWDMQSAFLYRKPAVGSDSGGSAGSIGARIISVSLESGFPIWQVCGSCCGGRTILIMRVATRRRMPMTDHMTGIRSGTARPAVRYQQVPIECTSIITIGQVQA